ncbi:hypothetical protein COU77_02160 [Candidatus Peregrinibacteria bacterium CG10_big_fil_rev_8_21_14_0_10_49_16]|nr:MAG: hypothetical protein COU77_02160 [Candidatus Peregrinibacteria bacterium CG10_big_fil_rev_8_21_14_0_10_49_16]
MSPHSREKVQIPQGVQVREGDFDVGESEVVPEPETFDRFGRIVRGLAADPSDRAALEFMVKFDELDFRRLVMALIFGENLPSNRQAKRIERFVRVQLDKGERLQKKQFTHPATPMWPRPNLVVPAEQSVFQQRHESMAIIGDGPVGIIMANLRGQLGYEYVATTLYSPKGLLGGIWQQDRVADGGHNTFSSIDVLGARLEAREPRPGSAIRHFLHLAQSLYVDHSLNVGRVTNVEIDPHTGQYIVTSVGPYGEEVQRFDSVLCATGNGIPKNLNAADAPMITNALDVRAPLKRWQEQIPRERWHEFHNTHPMVVGLGNSAIEMIQQFVQMREAGVNVRPRILTHYSRDALLHPNKMVRSEYGIIEGPIQRTRANLTKLALDIPRIVRPYDEALRQGWVVPDVTEWNVTEQKGSGKERRMTIEVRTRDGEVRRVGDVPVVYALVGYQNKPELMDSLNVRVVDDSGRIEYDPVLHQAHPARGTSRRMYVAGAMASRPGDRNQEVIPGALQAIAEIAFIEAVRGRIAVQQRAV